MTFSAGWFDLSARVYDRPVHRKFVARSLLLLTFCRVGTSPCFGRAPITLRASRFGLTSFWERAETGR